MTQHLFNSICAKRNSVLSLPYLIVFHICVNETSILLGLKASASLSTLLFPVYITHFHFFIAAAPSLALVRWINVFRLIKHLWIQWLFTDMSNQLNVFENLDLIQLIPSAFNTVPNIQYMLIKYDWTEATPDLSNGPQSLLV